MLYNLSSEMKMTIQDVLQKSIIFILGIALGYISWDFSMEASLFSVYTLFAYLLIDKRMTLGLLLAGYYLTSTRGMIQNVTYFYDNSFVAVLLWILPNILLVAVWVLVWHKKYTVRLILFLPMLTILSLPPIGYISGANPIVIAGIFFEGYKFLGIFMYLIIIMLLSVPLYYLFPNKKVVWGGLFVVILIILGVYKPSIIDDDKEFYALNTKYSYTPDAKQFEKHRRNKEFLSVIHKLPYEKIVLYENALGDFAESDMNLLRNIDHNKTLYAGANIYDRDKIRNDNVLLKINTQGYKILYKQRVPVPIEMWRPFMDERTRAYIFDNPVVEDDGERMAVFICYEMFISYTYLHSMLYDPTVLIGISNLWWSRDRDDTFMFMQRNTIHLWALLMGVPFYYSYNR